MALPPLHCSCVVTMMHASIYVLSCKCLAHRNIILMGMGTLTSEGLGSAGVRMWQQGELVLSAQSRMKHVNGLTAVPKRWP